MSVPGFCGLKNGGAPANPPMSTDPNADLIGLTFPVAGGVLTVTGPVSWSDAYVAVDTPAGPSVRVASQVRRRRELR